jgi:hypothetical protein
MWQPNVPPLMLSKRKDCGRLSGPHIFNQVTCDTVPFHSIRQSHVTDTCVMPKIRHYHGSQNWLPNRSGDHVTWKKCQQFSSNWCDFTIFGLFTHILALTALTAPNLDPSSAQNNPFVPRQVPKILPCHGHGHIVPKCRTDPTCHSDKAVPNWMKWYSTQLRVMWQPPKWNPYCQK